jgi:hypothetical protein
MPKTTLKKEKATTIKQGISRLRRRQGAMKTNEVCDCPLAPLAADTAMLLGFRRE